MGNDEVDKVEEALKNISGYSDAVITFVILISSTFLAFLSMVVIIQNLPKSVSVNRTKSLVKIIQEQECMFEHKDWRKCQDQVQEFKKCIAEHQKKPGIVN
ncbi:uncharacterized protein LOC136026251 isoform X2 [Artemia franciscana]|uniref:uncharacterized protein LOC136026251 isoform X2 n=1 Tax=Artemia franciscana TaxID=6661 RepID=UPI0032D9DE8F